MLRMKSVKAVQKITAAMKMVAASKLKGVETLNLKARPFGAAVDKFFVDVPAAPEDREELDGKHLLVPITSDRGLCGGINSSVVKAAKLRVQEDPELVMSIFGDKAKAGLMRNAKNNFSSVTTDISRKPASFVQASLLAERVLEVDSKDIDIIYNKFQSVIAFDTVTEKLEAPKDMTTRAWNTEYEFDDDEEEIVKDLSEFRIASKLYSSLLENATSEQSARMTAMDNASKNAGDMLDKLTLLYNRTRQAGITTELCEIVSGAEALKG
mmetsp:Transcript_6451/g.15981  ORF Transcript_6451/g.15981 Transcript_6451/m.15981 type:complete len:268 (+) Transcript_6451:242-1045(+)